jgi:hypothetical protein
MNKLRKVFILILVTGMVSSLLPGAFSVISAICEPSVQAADTKKCSVCRRTIKPGQNYYKAYDKIFCSKKCLAKYQEKKLPKCVVCGKPVKSGFTKDGKNYCSRKCLETTFPKCVVCGKRSSKGVMTSDGKFACDKCSAKPKCFCCSIPGATNKLQDGRYVCDKCLETAVDDQKDVEKVMNEVRAKLKENHNLYTRHDIAIKMVGLDELKKRSTHYAPGMELGLYMYEAEFKTVYTTKSSFFGKKDTTSKTSKTAERNSIYVLYGMPRYKLVEVIAHELGHDWMQENYPFIKDMKIKEGWAEYVASLVNKLYDQEHLNKRMQKNTDKIYGDGFRLISGKAEQGGKKALLKLFRQHNVE